MFNIILVSLLIYISGYITSYLLCEKIINSYESARDKEDLRFQITMSIGSWISVVLLLSGNPNNCFFKKKENGNKK